MPNDMKTAHTVKKTFQEMKTSTEHESSTEHEFVEKSEKVARALKNHVLHSFVSTQSQSQRHENATNNHDKPSATKAEVRPFGMLVSSLQAAPGVKEKRKLRCPKPYQSQIMNCATSVIHYAI